MFAKHFASLTLAVALSVGTAAAAAKREFIPGHTQRTIRLSVTTADAIVIATVAGSPEDARVKFTVDQVLMGEVEGDLLDLPLSGFYAPDLEEGSQLIISLKKRAGSDRFACNGRYERIIDGMVRDHAVDTYVRAVVANISKFQAVRSMASAQKRAPAAKPEIVANNSGT